MNLDVGNPDVVSFLTVVGAIILAILALLLAIIPAKIASKKGYSFAGFYIFGLFFWLVALIVALCLKGNRPDKALEGAESLKIYKDLLDSGTITQAEFDAKKDAILKGEK